MVFNTLQRTYDSPSWSDKNIYHTHGIFFDNAYLIGGFEFLYIAANLETALEEFEKAGVKTDLPYYHHNKPEVTRTSYGHWTYPRFDCIKVPLLTYVNDAPTITLAAAVLAGMKERLENYPLLDEDAYFKAEYKLARIALVQEINSLDLSDTKKYKLYDNVIDEGLVGTPNDIYRAIEYSIKHPVEDPDANEIEDATEWESTYDYYANINQNDVRKLMDYDI